MSLNRKSFYAKSILDHYSAQICGDSIPKLMYFINISVLKCIVVPLLDIPIKERHLVTECINLAGYVKGHSGPLSAKAKII